MSGVSIRYFVGVLVLCLLMGSVVTDVGASGRTKALKDLSDDAVDTWRSFVRSKGDELAKAGDDARRIAKFEGAAKLDPSDAKILDRFRPAAGSASLRQLDDAALNVAKLDPKTAVRILEGAPDDGPRILREIEGDGLASLKSLDSADEYSKTMVVVFRGIDDVKGARNVDPSLLKQLDEVNHSRGVLNFAFEYGKEGLKWIARNWKILAIAGGVALIWARPDLLKEFIDNLVDTTAHTIDKGTQTVGEAVGGGIGAFFKGIFVGPKGHPNWASIALVAAIVLSSIALLLHRVLKRRPDRVKVEVVSAPSEEKVESQATSDSPSEPESPNAKEPA